jgi:hypothetical protein
MSLKQGGNMQRYLRSTLAILMFAAVTLGPANAQTFTPADDTWVTGSGTQVDFSNFGNANIAQLLGSAPNNNVVSFTGVPLNRTSLGLADTLVSRGSVTIPPIGGQTTATLSIKGLALGSSPDVTLQDGRVYHVAVSLATQSDTGSITFNTTTAEGGTFNSSFTVTPIFTFTNVNNPNEAAHTLNCADPAQACSFPINGSGNWVKTSSTGFDPQSVGIPTVPAGVAVGGYTTVGRSRFGGIQVGCGGTKSAGYGCGFNQEMHGQGSIGQALHGTKPPTDCALPAPSPTPVPQPSPTPVPPPSGGGCASTTGTISCAATVPGARTITKQGSGTVVQQQTPGPTPTGICAATSN